MLNIAYCSDKYQYTMGKSFYDSGMKDKHAVFNLFYRKAPENNNWAVVSGVDEVIEMVMNLGNMDQEFFEKFLPGEEYADYRGYLSSMKFTGTIYAMREGEIAFPNQPIIIIEGPLIEAQVLETPMLCIMNHQMAVATKASRVCRATNRPVSEFGSRRAHGPWAATFGAKAALIAGCQSTSNILTGVINDYGSSGTMAHSYVTAFGSSVAGEYKAFDTYIKTHIGEPLVLLIDTYDTLKSGLPNAITVFKELREKGYEPIGVRLDSGDLAYLTKTVRRLLDIEGFPNAKIFVSGDLDEYTIESLHYQGAQIDVYGVGTRLITSHSNPSLGGVYKIAEFDGKPKMKISNNAIKITNPGEKEIYRIYDGTTHMAVADFMCEKDEKFDFSQPLTITHPTERWKKQTIEDYFVKSLYVDVIKNGEVVYEFPTVAELQRKCTSSLNEFWSEYKRLDKPQIYKVDLSDKLYDLKQELLAKGAKVGVIATKETKDKYIGGEIVVIGSRADEGEIASGLYGILRDFDQLDVDYIFSESFASDDLGQAIMNRLLKAAGYQVVRV